MANESTAFDAERKRPTIGGAFASLSRLKAMELPTMPHERRNANQLLVIRKSAPAHNAISQRPGIDTVGFPPLRQLLTRLLEPQLIAQCRRFPSLFDAHGCEFVQGIVEPKFADFQRREIAVPPAPFPFVRSCPNILYDKGTHWKEAAENRHNPQFPLPTRPGRRWELLFALPAVLAWLTTGSLSAPARAAHPGTVRLGFPDAL